MISWIIIVLFVVVGIIVIKMANLKHRVWIFLLILFALFLYSTMAIVTSKNNIQLNSAEGVIDGIKVYSGWLANSFQNLKVLTGNAFKLDWQSTNASFADKNNKKTSNTKMVKK